MEIPEYVTFPGYDNSNKEPEISLLSCGSELCDGHRNDKTKNKKKTINSYQRRHNQVTILMSENIKKKIRNSYFYFNSV